MNSLKIKSLFIYPLKSCGGTDVIQISVDNNGLKYDRNFAVINKNNTIITAREYPKLLKIETLLKKSKLSIHLENETFQIDHNLFSDQIITVQLFNEIVKAESSEHYINNQLSEYLGEQCKLVKFSTIENSIKNKAFNDVSPIHLISEASLNDLNNKLKNPFTAHSFRPNIVISGGEAYEEESWKTLKIGTCKFKVVSKTARCSMITIDPKSLQKNKNQEPLRTLATYKKEDKSVNFGIYLEPINFGDFSIDDKIEITSETAIFS
ncbi:MOSC domain-containing protein [Aquimarina agarilytica]|uniref:MOSC domain-containing protein n=1 Tax=Aquimarina agarilytica TaxID=1087449 RepID=UPI0002899924|nr:MOSC N-terminal beta barrel domain-containing protein [Aquimarina agarilytica]